MVKILFVDDHTLFRESIIKMLTLHFPGSVFGEAESSSQAIELLLNNNWDLLILDLKMPGRSGLDIIREVKKLRPLIPILILTMYPEDQFALRSIKAGASGYLTKSISSKILVKAIEKILEGGVFFTGTTSKLMSNSLINRDKGFFNHEALTDRELEVFLLIASGNRISDIAMELNLSVKTISVYRANILKKMNLKNNAEITSYAFKHKLVE
jgi:two-component system invasion response regulator UvrY